MVFPLEVGDLCTTSPLRRRIALARPFAGVALFAVMVHIGWWWLTPLVMFAIFVAVVTVTHEVVHRCLALGPRSTDWALFFMGLVLLESGHAYRITHLQHHRLFPHPTDDPEGYPAGMTLLGAVCYGPVFLVRLWWWAWRTGRDRVWLAIEAAVPILALAVGVLSLASFPGILVYVTMAIAGSWVYPLLTADVELPLGGAAAWAVRRGNSISADVELPLGGAAAWAVRRGNSISVYLPHHDYGDTPLSQTRTLRGRILPAIFLELPYHLEHHLYPQVPSHKLPELGRRLDPYFAASGVKPVRVL